MSDLKVLSVASEIFPLVKTGGLADVVGALPGALAREGVEVRTLVPAYPAILAKLAGAATARDYDHLFGAPARVIAGKAAGLDLFAIDAPHLFDRPGNPYLGPDGLDWPDNARRFAALGRVAADIGRGAIDGYRPQVVHAHDWQAALAPAYLHYADGPRPGTAVTIHNIAFQGHYPVSIFGELGLPPRALAMDGVEYFGGVGYLKAGLQLSDRITTVSPTYAREIMTPEFGNALDGLLRARAAVVQGIVNGIDGEVWNPATDPVLAQNYSALRIEMRVRNKTALQNQVRLAPEVERPLFAVISRLSGQKGLDLLLAALPNLIAKGGQFALLGSGDRLLEFGLCRRRRGAGRLGRLRFRLRREARPSHPGGRRLHRCAFALRALRPDAALRSSLRRRADRGACRRARRHSHRRQCGGHGRRRGDRRPILPTVRRRVVVRARPSAGNKPRSRDDAASQGQRHADGRFLARSGEALRRALSHHRQACRMSGVEAALGVVVSARGLEAALDLPNAERASLCLYDGDHEVFRAKMTRDPRGVLRGLAPGFGAGARYGFRVEGPYDPARGARFDPSKLLADPYGWRFDRPFRLHPSMFAFGDDSGPFAPKAIAGAPPAGEPGRKRVAPEALIIYELNLRGFSRLNPAIPESARATFAGLAHPASIAHLAALGVTAVEIMPADAFVDERHLPPLGLSNAWGYNAVVFGAPDPRLAPGGWADVRAATDALHAAGIEAILDVVFNHNGESDQFGPTLSFRGLDNATWFRLDPSNPATYINDMGTGNCLALDRPLVIDMAIGALKRWMIHGGFDGFRFDLATALGRRAKGFDPHAPFFDALAADPVLKNARLIAEPWDVGPGGYRLGQFGPAFAEWNDRFRDAARRFWRGDPRMRGEIATRIAGSRDVFGAAAAPSKSVNFVVAHDGFTLRDLVSYERKHNEANGENNRDGTDNNYSWSHGVEGPSEDPAIVEARSRDERNLMTLLLTSRGTPMLGMGAELGFSQGGNNNAYAQDNATSAIDWRAADASLIAFTARLTEVRRAHPALSRDAFLAGTPFDASGLLDVEWRDADGPMTQRTWNDPEGAVLVAVFAAPQGESVDRVAVAMNRSSAETEVRLPLPRAGMAWRALIDTHDPEAPERPIALADRGAPARALLAHSRRGADGERRPPFWRAQPRDDRQARDSQRVLRRNGLTSPASARSFRRRPRSRFSMRSAWKRRAKLRRARA